MTKTVLEYFMNTILFIGVAFGMIMPFDTFASSRIKDIIQVEGVRSNPLVGYGLVVGLNGTGDTLQNSPFTEQAIIAMLERFGTNTRNSDMRNKNVAAVMVTAELGAFARHGTKIDVGISSMGDAQDLTGGTLLVTSLMGADGEVYAVAQGSLAVAGFTATGDAGSVTQGVPTSGRIANGATIEREIGFEMNDMLSLRLSLNNPDFTTSRRIAEAINEFMGNETAHALDPSTVQLLRPIDYKKTMFDLIADIEHLEVDPDTAARVVIDDRSGIIVMGSMVRVSTVAIAQGNLTVRVSETPEVSQPGAFSDGDTVTTPSTAIEIDDGSDRRLTVLSSSVTLQDLVDGLNALGIGPRDMISILQAIKAAGAMQAELEVM